MSSSSTQFQIRFDKWYTAYHLQFIKNNHGYEDIVRSMQKWDLAAFNNLYLLTNSNFYKQLLSGEIPFNVDETMAFNPLPLLFSASSHVELERVLRDVELAVNRDMASLRGKEAYALILRNSPAINMINESVIHTKALKGIFSVMIMAYIYVKQPVGEELFIDSDVIDKFVKFDIKKYVNASLNNNIDYFRDKITWVINKNGSLTISLRDQATLGAVAKKNFYSLINNDQLNISMFEDKTGVKFVKGKTVFDVARVFGLTTDMLDWFVLTYWSDLFDALQEKVFDDGLYKTEYDEGVLASTLPEIPLDLIKPNLTIKVHEDICPEISLVRTNVEINMSRSLGPSTDIVITHSLNAFHQRVVRAKDLRRDKVSKSNSALSRDVATYYAEVFKDSNVVYKSFYTDEKSLASDAFEIFRSYNRQMVDDHGKPCPVYSGGTTYGISSYPGLAEMIVLPSDAIDLTFQELPLVDLYVFDLLPSSGIVQLKKDKTFFSCCACDPTPLEDEKLAEVLLLINYGVHLSRVRKFKDYLPTKFSNVPRLTKKKIGNGVIKRMILKVPLLIGEYLLSLYFQLGLYGLNYEHVMPIHPHEEWRWLVIDIDSVGRDNVPHDQIDPNMPKYITDVVNPWICAIERRHLIHKKTPSNSVSLNATNDIVSRMGGVYSSQHFELFPSKQDLSSVIRDIPTNLSYIQFHEAKLKGKQKAWKEQKLVNKLEEDMSALSALWSEAVSFTAAPSRYKSRLKT